MIKSIFLVSCVGKKQPYACKAMDLYVSDWFKKASQYARLNADEWYILSAKYILVQPMDTIEPYDLTLTKMNIALRREWADKVMLQLHPHLTPGNKITFLAGKTYREFLQPALLQRGYSVNVPMNGFRIGEQLGWLKSRLNGG